MPVWVDCPKVRSIYLRPAKEAEDGEVIDANTVTEGQSSDKKSSVKGQDTTKVIPPQDGKKK